MTDNETGQPLAGTLVILEGTDLRSVADSAGRFLLLAVPSGPQVLRAERIGYAQVRIPLTLPVSGTLVRDVRMASSALQIEGILVSADPAGRARGELGTASVIEHDAIRHQTAASLAGLLELVPGIPMQPPGLDGVQQVSLRSVPVSSTSGESVGAGAGALASTGTLIVLDGVPLSNNANLQTLGPRGELPLSTSAGGGIDLRRIPAALIERIEVIRGIPSARYGDLTQGAIVVDTRAGAVDPDIAARKDRQTTAASVVGGTSIGEANTGLVMFDVTRTLLQPGVREDEALRVAAQLAHRYRTGGGRSTGGDRLTLDTRVDYFQIYQDSPENIGVQPGRASRNRDSGLRLAHRARLRLARGSVAELTASLDHQRQRSFTQAIRQRGAMPFTRSLTEGRSIGHFIGGSYLARVDVDGDPWLAYTRLELSDAARFLGLDHSMRAGVELRREWNTGPGYTFDMEFPPQTVFNGVQGFDRPRRYDDIPALATSTVYLDDAFSRGLGSSAHLNVQAGVRVDMLHSDGSWFSGIRASAVQPRLNAQLAPWPWLRLRAGAGRTAKQPTLADLYPSPQYHDVVNVNWFANDPAERLAVLTTFILDPTNPDVRPMITTKREAGFEIGFGSRGGGFSLVAFRDRMAGGLTLDRRPDFLLREHFQLADSTAGSGAPPQIIEPAFRADTVPVLLLQPSNAATVDTRGYEMTLSLPEIEAINTRLEVHGAWIKSRYESDVIEVGSYFSDFQLRGNQARTPYWSGTTRTGERVLLNYRVTHQQPSIGLVVTATVQHVPREILRNIGGADSLSFEGYITRTGVIAPVPAAERNHEQYSDIQLPRRNLLTEPTRTPGEWLASVQVSKTLPLDGRVSFYAFNAGDRVGQYGRPGFAQRLHPPTRFGIELMLRPQALFR